ncbi:MAG: cation-translocating P-type ATPase [Chloroflexi bacterium]|nr:cation-translocating P-type ATPase [Chloroflexota bacterium]
MGDWYKSETKQVVAILETNPETGLSAAEAQQRLAQYGLNELVEKGAKSPWLILWEQLTEIMVVILIVAAAVSAFFGEVNDVIVILAIVVLNAILGFTQEYRAEKAIAALKKLAVPTVTVRRDGRIEEISARELVPGDIVLLETGDLIPADGRLVESVNLRVQEAALTGESEAVDKVDEVLSGDDLPLGDRRNMVFMGTVSTYGRGTAVITETGMNTELGNIADLLQTVEQEQTPLQRRLGDLGKTLAWGAMAIIAVVIILGMIRSDNILRDLEELILTGISMAVAAVPEGLPAVVAITLALGSQRMLKRNSLIRKLPAVETLGSVTTICSDKTGTLTQNRMTVTVLDVDGRTADVRTLLNAKGFVQEMEPDDALPTERTLNLLVKAGALCNDAVIQTNIDGETHVIGDPTEGALVMAAAELGFTKERLAERWPRVAEVPFTSERKRMTTIHETSDSPLAFWGDSPFIAFTKGSVDGLLEVASHLWTGNEIIPIDDVVHERISDANEQLASRGQRVLGVAFRAVPNYEFEEETKLEKDMVFVGLTAMMDPPRPEVREAVVNARTAGVRSVMITGDHPLTARAVAQNLTIASDGASYLTGQDLAQMGVADLKDAVHDISVYARVSPEHKLNIVEALQEKGEIVAMTGDGVNDAPALKRADIGVAMGITGTDVSKEAADMVLLDDNFATIVAAIEEGRVIFDNIRKFIKYTLSSNIGELIVMLIGPFLGMPLPLVPLQILWINLVTDGLPGLALAVESGERGIMKRPPFHPKESIFSRGMGQRILWIGILMGLVALVPGYLYWRMDPNGPWQTITFTTLTLAQMGNALAIRSNTDSIFSIGFFSNRLMLVSILLTFGLQLALIYVPFLQTFFRTESLSLRDLLISLAISSVIFIVVELEKWMRRRK